FLNNIGSWRRSMACPRNPNAPAISSTTSPGWWRNYETAPRIAGEPLKRLRVGFAEPGDVILSHKGTVGRVAICDVACVLSPQTTYYRPSPSAFTPEFLRFQLLRVCPKTSGRITKFSEHEAD